MSKSINRILKSALLTSSVLLFSAGAGMSACYVGQDGESFCDGPKKATHSRLSAHKYKHSGGWRKHIGWKTSIRFGVRRHHHHHTCLKFTATAKHRTQMKSIRLAERSLGKSLRKNTGHGFHSKAVRVADPQCWATTPGIINCSIKAKVCQ